MASGNAATDSLKVAKGFGKRYDDVLKTINNLDCDENFRLLDFAESSYTEIQ